MKFEILLAVGLIVAAAVTLGFLALDVSAIGSPHLAIFK